MNRPGPPRFPDLVVAMTGASGAPYAVRLLQILGRLDRTVHLTISASAVQVLREEMALEVDLDSFNPAFCGGTAADRLIYHHYQDFNASIASGSFPTGGMVVIPCSMSTLGAIAGGHNVQPDHPRRRRAFQGAAQADPGTARNAIEPDPSREHGERDARRRGRPSGHARLVSPAPAASRPDRFRGRPHLRSARDSERPGSALGHRNQGRCARTNAVGRFARSRRDRARPTRRRLSRWRWMRARPGPGTRACRLDHRCLCRPGQRAGPRARPAEQSQARWC